MSLKYLKNYEFVLRSGNVSKQLNFNWSLFFTCELQQTTSCTIPLSKQREVRFCSHCNTQLTVDKKNRLCQLVLIIFSVILLIVFFIPFPSTKIMTATGSIVFLLYVFYANKKLVFEKTDNSQYEKKNND